MFGLCFRLRSSDAFLLMMGLNAGELGKMPDIWRSRELILVNLPKKCYSKAKRKRSEKSRGER